MTEGLDNLSVPSAPDVIPAPAPSAPAERTFRQSEVNDLIGRVKQETEQKVLKRQQESVPQYNQAPAYDNYQRQPQANSVDESSIRRMAAEEAQRLRDNWVSESQARHEQDIAQRTVNQFWDKIASGKDKYDDFEKITGDIEYARFPNVVQLLADHMDNSADVLYELGKNRMKMAQLEQLSQLSPRDAIIEAKRLADSIKDNDAAKNMRVPNAPLSQQRPSHTGTDAGGVLSMRDLKAKYKV